MNIETLTLILGVVAVLAWMSILIVSPAPSDYPLKQNDRPAWLDKLMSRRRKNETTNPD